MTDVKFLNFIYQRMVNVHGEKPNVDYMLRLKSIIEKGLTLDSKMIMQPMDTAPTDGTHIIALGTHEDDCSVEHQGFCEVYTYDVHGWYNIAGYPSKPKYWMPRPDAVVVMRPSKSEEIAVNVKSDFEGEEHF